MIVAVSDPRKGFPNLPNSCQRKLHPVTKLARMAVNKWPGSHSLFCFGLLFFRYFDDYPVIVDKSEHLALGQVHHSAEHLARGDILPGKQQSIQLLLYFGGKSHAVCFYSHSMVPGGLLVIS